MWCTTKPQSLINIVYCWSEINILYVMEIAPPPLSPPEDPLDLRIFIFLCREEKINK
jgi:hypothetical protein